jgi:cytochrome P450
MLMSATDESRKERMDAKQLRDEVLTLVLAGHETTANLLAFTFHLLSTHPEWDRRVADEVTAVLGDRDPAFEDVPKLKITRMVLEEAMRLFPPVWTFERQALADDVVMGYALPKDAIVGISPYALHRHPKLWDNPEGFDPERFLPERSAGRSKYAYLPFGGGPRTCIGNNFAMMEAQIILAMVAREKRLTRVPGHRLVLDPTVTLRPKDGIKVTIEPR